jgi:hypothetical protein
LSKETPSAPSLFNLILDAPAFEFEQECRRKGWGFNMDGFAVPIILFADNCWLLARDPKELENMTESWIKCLTQHGFHIPVDEISVCTTAPDDSPCRVHVGGSRLIRKPRAVGYKVLGTILSFDGRNSAEIKDRMNKAERAFWANRTSFINKSNNIVSKLKLLAEILRAVGLWCACVWHLTQKQKSQLRALQTKLMRKFITVKDTGMLDETMGKLGRKIGYWKRKAGWVDIDKLQEKLVHNWGGHVARMETYRPDSLTTRVLAWRDRRWLLATTSRNGCQMHGRRFRVWRWEQQIYEKHGENWRKLALDKDAWEKDLYDVM